MDGYIPENPLILKHIFETQPQDSPRLYHLVNLASAMLIELNRPMVITDFIYHKIYADIILGIDSRLIAHGQTKLSPHEEIRLVMASSLGARLYITGAPYPRFIQILTICSEILVDSLRSISRILEKAEPVVSKIEPQYDDQTQAARLAVRENISIDIDSNDLLTLYYVYRASPNKRTEDKIRTLVEHKQMHAIESLKPYDDYLKKIQERMRSQQKQVFLQPILNSTEIEGYRFHQATIKLAKHGHTITKSKNDAQDLYESSIFESRAYPVTVNSLVKSLNGKWIDYDQYNLRLGATLNDVDQMTYEINKTDGNLIEKSWKLIDMRFCPVLFQVNVLRFLEPRNEHIDCLLLGGHFKAWVLSAREINAMISDSLFERTGFKPWMLLNAKTEVKKLFQTAEMLGYREAVIQVKTLMHDLRKAIEANQPLPDHAIQQFLLLDCPASKILQSITPCNLRFDLLIVKPKYQLFQDFISAIVTYASMPVYREKVLYFLTT